MVAIMTFPYDIRSNLTMLVDLLNTAGGIAESGDELTTTTGLRDFAARHDFSGPLTATKTDVEATRRLRDRFDYDEQLDESLDEDVRMTREMLLMEPGGAPKDKAGG